MNLESKKTFDSKAVPGVKFTLRRLNQQQRAKRDLAVASEKLEYGKLCTRWLALQKEYEGRESERPEDVVRECELLDYRIGLLLNAFIKPATIRAAFIRIEKLDESGKPEPFTLDGRPYTAETFVEQCDNDALIDEVWAEAERLAGLTVKQSEVFSSPSPSEEAAASKTPSTTATPATTQDGGASETAPSSIQSTSA